MTKLSLLLSVLALITGLDQEASAKGALGFTPAGAELSAVTIAPANLKLSVAAQNIAPPRYDAAHGFERSDANPTLTALTVGGKPYVYMLMRVERGVEQGNRLILARIAAEKFSDGTLVTPFPQWEQVPDDVFSIVPPEGSKGVLNASMAAENGRLVITYQARNQSKDSADNLGFMVLYDPASQKVIWQKPVPSIAGYQGNQKPTGLTRVTQGPVATSGDYFDSSKGRLVLGYMCRQDSAPACTDNGTPWDGFVLQELTFTGDTPQFQPPVRVVREAVPVGMKVKAWAKAGETVWKKQSFNFGNGGSDRLIFAFNFNMVAEDSADHPAARDFPEHAKFFVLSSLTTLLDAAKSGPIDISAKVPPSRTWVPDLTNDSPWDQGAMWNSMYYADPFHANRQFVLYESWGAERMQAAQTRNALYGGSAAQVVKADSAAFGQSCDDICATNSIAGGGARKPFCLSATAVAPGTAMQGTEISHQAPLRQMAPQGLQSAYLVCSDIGTSKAKADNLTIASGTVGASTAGQPALTVAEGLCSAQRAKGVVWMDAISAGKTRANLSDAAVLHQGDALTVGCSVQYPSSAFHRAVMAASSGQSCDMTCAALGPGDGTGFRAWRSQLLNSPYPNQTTALIPSMSVDLLIQLGKTRAKPWTPLQSTGIACACGPGREMRGVASARVAP